MIWVIMESEDRRDIEASLVFRVSLDLQAQQVSRELQELLDQAGRGGLQDLLDLQVKRDTLANQDRWDLQELVESLEKLVLRVLLESPDPLALLVPQDLPWLLWTTCLLAFLIMTQVPLPLLSLVRMRLCPTATPPPSWLWTLACTPP